MAWRGDSIACLCEERSDEAISYFKLEAASHRTLAATCPTIGEKMSTLYLTQPGAQLHKDHDRLLVKRGEEVALAEVAFDLERSVALGGGGLGHAGSG